MNVDTRPWVRKAEADHQVSTQIAAENPPLHDMVCFHCQQSAEKYLKALLVELGIAVPYTHNLRDLLMLLLPHRPDLKSYSRGLAFLTIFAVPARYPGYSATKRQAAAALRWEGRIRDACRKILKIRTRPRKTK